MKESKAIRIGHFLITIPIVVIMVITFLVAFYGVNHKILHWFVIPLCFILGPFFGWIYWTFAITRWRLWAYSFVDDIDELKIQGIESGLLWSENSIIKRTEFRTKQQSINLDKLETEKKGLLKTKEIAKNYSIPSTTKISISKLNLYLAFSLGLLFPCLAIYLLSTDEPSGKTSGILSLLIGIYILYNAYKIYLKTNIRFHIGESGIEYNGNKYSWREITNETTKRTGSGKNVRFYFNFNVKNKAISIEMNDYNISLKELRGIIKEYKRRYRKTASNNG